MASQKSSVFDQLDALLAQGKITDEEYHDLWSALRGHGGQVACAPDTRGSARHSLTSARVLGAIGLTVMILFGLIGLVSGKRDLAMLGAITAIGLWTALSQSQTRQRRLLFARVLGTIGLGGMVFLGLVGLVGGKTDMAIAGAIVAIGLYIFLSQPRTWQRRLLLTGAVAAAVIVGIQLKSERAARAYALQAQQSAIPFPTWDITQPGPPAGWSQPSDQDMAAQASAQVQPAVESTVQ